MTWLMKILNIHQVEQLQIKYYVKKHLISLKVLDMMDAEEILLQWFIIFLIKKTAPGGAVKSEIVQNKELAE